LAGPGAEEEHGDVDVPLLGAHELMRHADERQVLLANAMHGSLPRETPP
jgi:hypothetical protein